MRRLILDTGPLVARLCPRDQHHAWACCVFDDLAQGSLVCEAVLVEACHLAAKDGVPRGKVIEFVERGRLHLVSLATELAAIRSLLDHYADAPMDFTDACIVRLAELNPNLAVCTVDRDFTFFRKHGTGIIPLAAPFTLP